jgi:hypothetical protein
MKSERQQVDSPSPERKGAKNYASLQEVEEAITALTDADHAKLMLIAHFFCKRRGISANEMEPGELLSEAILATCKEGGKRWNKAIPIVRHLDRAMENISGHFIRDRKTQHEKSKIVSFASGLRPEEDEKKVFGKWNEDQTSLAAKEKAKALIQDVFGDDERSKEVFLMRAEEHPVSEILLKLKLTETEYETIARQIRRRISKFLAQTK